MRRAHGLPIDSPTGDRKSPGPFSPARALLEASPSTRTSTRKTDYTSHAQGPRRGRQSLLPDPRSLAPHQTVTRCVTEIVRWKRPLNQFSPAPSGSQPRRSSVSTSAAYAASAAGLSVGGSLECHVKGGDSATSVI